MSAARYEMQLKELIGRKNIGGLRGLFDGRQVIDLVSSVEQLSISESLFLFKALNKDVSGQIFTYLSYARQQELIDAFSGTQITELLENVYSDDIVDLIGELPANLTKKILLNASPDTRKEINLLLSYPEDSAGSIMSCDYFELKESDTVDEALKKLKRQGKTAETINTCFVIDDTRRLVGSILLKNFLFESGEVLLSSIMDKDPVYVLTSADQEEVAAVIKRYDIAIVPVVNNEERLIGIITVDDIMDIMEEEVTEDIHRMNAIKPLEGSYAEASVLSIVGSRLPWLVVLMITDMLNGAIINNYESAITAIPALAGFMPVIMGTAGNAGSQASTMVIRAISTRDVGTKDFWRVLGKELVIGLICSAVLFAVCYLKLTVFPSELSAAAGVVQVAISVSASVCIALIIGKAVGGILPLVVCWMHLDPASVAAPLITTIADTAALLTYFEIVSAFFKL